MNTNRLKQLEKAARLRADEEPTIQLIDILPDGTHVDYWTREALPPAEPGNVVIHAGIDLDRK